MITCRCSDVRQDGDRPHRAKSEQFSTNHEFIPQISTTFGPSPPWHGAPAWRDQRWRILLRRIIIPDQKGSVNDDVCSRNHKMIAWPDMEPLLGVVECQRDCQHAVPPTLCYRHHSCSHCRCSANLGSIPRIRAESSTARFQAPRDKTQSQHWAKEAVQPISYFATPKQELLCPKS